MAKFFSKNSKKYLRTYKRKGLAREQRMLVEGITSKPLIGKTLLEIGCGVGGLHLALLKCGAASAVGIDAAEGMIEKAKILARDESLEGSTQYLLGDFVALQPAVAAADVTILDKVVCCYENAGELVAKSLEKTRSVYALSFPKPHFLVKWSFVVPIIAAKMFRWSFHPYWHDWQKLLDSIEQRGFQKRYENSTLMWSICVFERSE